MKSCSVIIPNLNSPVIDETIKALEQQSYDRSAYEVIVVGLDKYGIVKESDVVHFDQCEQPLSPARARNRGAQKASGEVLIFTDADCIPEQNWLAILANSLSDPSINVLGGGVLFDTKNYWRLSDNLSMFYDYLAFHPPGNKPQLPSLNLAVRRKVFEAVGGFDERYPYPSGEDADLTIRLKKNGYCLYFEPRAVVFHAPTRSNLRDLLLHGYYQGKYSTKVDKRYKLDSELPGFLGTRLGLIIFSPILATGSTLRIFGRYKNLLRYWFTAPAIFLAKLAWCVGAAAHPDWRNCVAE